MTIRPILFSGPMVRALLEGRKTQTRRVLKPQPLGSGIIHYGKSKDTPANWTDTTGMTTKLPIWAGDLLYVREAWRTLHKWNHIMPKLLMRDRSTITYEADPENRNPLWAFGKFRQGMHMPRWASRLTLKVTDVQIEQVQEISELDARSEGVEPIYIPDIYDHQVLDGWVDYQTGGQTDTAKVSFETLWDSLNDKRSFGWDANPWVAAYTFTVHHCNVDEFNEVAA